MSARSQAGPQLRWCEEQPGPDVCPQPGQSRGAGLGLLCRAPGHQGPAGSLPSLETGRQQPQTALSAPGSPGGLKAAARPGPSSDAETALPEDGETDQDQVRGPAAQGKTKHGGLASGCEVRRGLSPY